MDSGSEGGFLALEDETVFWMMNDNEAFVARRFKRGRRPNIRPGSPGRATGGKRRPVLSQDPTDPSCCGKGKEEGNKGGKGKDMGDKGNSFKGAKKGQGKYLANPTSSTTDQANASPGAYEVTATPGWDDWQEDSHYVDPGWNYAAYDE